MNIRLSSDRTAALYSGPDCPFCSRPLPENGTCKCGVWRRVKVATPTYLIETTPDCDKLVNTTGYWSEQFKAAKIEALTKKT